MINPEAQEKINQLYHLYKQRWGKDLDDNIRPISLDQEKFVLVLERIVDTGESILVGYNKLFLTKNHS
ncbi:MAG: hypothetical protein K2K70_04135 [Lachnospiraceae bacterium]|nr:hypothetical protein [Lachnospiraceae bacterium]